MAMIDSHIPDIKGCPVVVISVVPVTVVADMLDVVAVTGIDGVLVVSVVSVTVVTDMLDVVAVTGIDGV